jgi:hypothetical protein
MKTHLLISGLLMFGAAALAADLSHAGAPNHRYVVERSFPQGALDHLDADATVRAAARANHLPVDAITEVPVTLESEAK